MFFIRLNKMKVFNNREADLFGLNRAEMRIYSRVSAGTDTSLRTVTLADFEGLSNDPAGITERLKKLVLDEAGGIAQFNFLEINGVKDNDSLYFGDAGFLVFQDGQIPETLNIQMLVVEADNDIRSLALDVDAVVNNDLFKGVAGSILTALAATTPGWGAAVAIGKLAFGILLNKQKKNDDDLVGYWQCTLNRREHYPNGLRDKQDVRDVTGNILVDYTFFGYENGINNEQ
jgi:hypothetical protein